MSRYCFYYNYSKYSLRGSYNKYLDLNFNLSNLKQFYVKVRWLTKSLANLHKKYNRPYLSETPYAVDLTFSINELKL